MPEAPNSLRPGLHVTSHILLHTRARALLVRAEYADIAGWSLTGSSPITTVTGATAGPAFTGTTGYTGAPGTTTATTGSGTVGSGTLSGVVGAARDKLAALESKIPFIGELWDQALTTRHKHA